MSDPVQSTPDTDPVGTVRACMDDIGNWLLAVRKDVLGSRWSNYIGTYRHGNEPEGVDGWPWPIIGVIPGSPAAEAQQLRQDLPQVGTDLENPAPPGTADEQPDADTRFRVADAIRRQAIADKLVSPNCSEAVTLVVFGAVADAALAAAAGVLRSPGGEDRLSDAERRLADLLSDAHSGATDFRATARRFLVGLESTELRQRVTAKLDQIESQVQALAEDERMDLRGRYLCGARDALMTVLGSSGGGSDLTVEGAQRRAEARAHRRRSAADIRHLIERSSLGTPGAQALRKSASGAALTREEQRAADAELAELEGSSDG